MADLHYSHQINHKLNLLIHISQARLAGFHHYAEALCELYRKEFSSQKK